MNDNESNFKTLARCAPNAWVNDFAKQMRKAGYTVDRDRKAETIVASHNGNVVARGMKMGAMGWLVRADPQAVAAK